MPVEREDRCGRCGAGAFALGEPYTFWIWLTDGHALREHALRLCQPCGRDVPSQQARSEYLRHTLFG